MFFYKNMFMEFILIFLKKIVHEQRNNILTTYSGQTIRLCFRSFQHISTQLCIHDVRFATGSILGVSESMKSDNNIERVNLR